jgi:hypothetical protein
MVLRVMCDVACMQSCTVTSCHRECGLVGHHHPHHPHQLQQPPGPWSPQVWSLTPPVPCAAAAPAVTAAAWRTSWRAASRAHATWTCPGMREWQGRGNQPRGGWGRRLSCATQQDCPWHVVCQQHVMLAVRMGYCQRAAHTWAVSCIAVPRVCCATVQQNASSDHSSVSTIPAGEACP